MKTNMASFLKMMMVLVLVINAEAASKEFKVGDEFGWHEPDINNTLFYNQWASRNRFQVGDALSFEYNKNDSVMVVDKWGYYHCDTSNPIAAYDNGKSVVQLDRPGPFYFISGGPDHCKKGQRLVVDVMSPHPHDPHPDHPYAPHSATSPSPAPASSGVLVSEAAPTWLLMALIAAIFSTLLWSSSP
ncbi:hypothetical protein FNV43_RR06796 [Rhamnella rubrinervis]|uniref:Phytocyanin domain-containing protein n=1 Tax=Rhamnella rubrinervis TaxID=2594499 RepID=A0A8K0HDK6_9ROSA|nr:hypothetical protein FNV43_RR06796 [Rhamnella rubrinervis]